MLMTDFLHKPTLTGERVVLRPIVASDGPSMWQDFADIEANRLTGTRGTFTQEQIEQWCATRAEQDDRLDLAVTDPNTGDWCGEVVISDWEEENQACSFRIALSAHARDRGMGTEATRLILDYVFDELAVNRVELEVYSFNPRARAVYERVGFVHEGTRREALLWEDERVDAIMMSMLRSDRP